MELTLLLIFTADPRQIVEADGEMLPGVGVGRKGGTENVEIIYTVITRLELNKLNTELERIEPDAFVVMSSVKDTRGGMIKKRPLKH